MAHIRINGASNLPGNYTVPVDAKYKIQGVDLPEADRFLITNHQLGPYQ